MMDMEDFPYQLTVHAQQVITARNIELAWIVRVLQSPEKVEMHPQDFELRYAFARIPENENRV